MRTSLLLLSIFLVFWGRSQTDFQLHGLLRSISGDSISGGWLKLEEDDSVVANLRTDINGKFEFRGKLNADKIFYIHYKKSSCDSYMDSLQITIPYDSTHVGTKTILLDLNLLNRCNLSYKAIYYDWRELKWNQNDFLCYFQEGLFKDYKIEFTLLYNPEEGEELQAKRIQDFLVQLARSGVDISHISVNPETIPLTIEAQNIDGRSRMEGTIIGRFN